MPTHRGRPEFPPWHVERPRLAEPAGDRLVVVVAGSGYGKTTLVREAAAGQAEVAVEVTYTGADRDPLAAARRFANAVRDSSLPTGARLAERDEDDPAALVALTVDAVLGAAPLTDAPIRVVLDDVHHLDPAAAAVMGLAVTTLLGPDRAEIDVRVSVAGRAVPDGLLDPALSPTVLTTADLALEGTETSEVLVRGWAHQPDAATVSALLRASRGWPAAVVLAAPRVAQAPGARRAEEAGRRTTLARLVAGLLEPLDDHDVTALAQCARLPLLGPALDRALGRPELFVRSRAAGLPYNPAGDGWWSLPDVVRAQLAEAAPPDASVLAAAAHVYTKLAMPLAGAAALADAGALSATTDLLAELTPSTADGIDLRDLLAVTERLPNAELERRPEVLLHIARACIPAVAIDRRRRCLARVTTAATTPTIARAALAEQALDLVRDGEARAAEQIARTLLDECGADEVITRCRAFDVLGRATAWQAETDAELREAAEHLRTAAALARRADAAGIAAEALLALGYVVDYRLGRFDHALVAIDEALDLVANRLRRRATVQTFRAEVLHALGRDDEAREAIADARHLGGLLGDDRIIAYAAWEAAKGAARRADRSLTLELLDEAMRHRGTWFDHPTGMVFLADAGECCERVGEPELADTHLRRATEMMHALIGDDDLSVWLARAGCAARSGDPLDALVALDVVDRLPGLAPRDRWRPLALRSVALMRRGDRTGAAALARAALDAAVALGTPQLPDVLEPTLAPVLRSLAHERPEVAVPATQIRVLGAFEVSRAGVRIPLTPGLPAQLVKVLAVHGGRLHQEAAVEALWPDGDVAGASQRLRNVLHRLRDTGLVRRDGPLLVLASEVAVDLAEFTSLVARARRGAPDRVDVARRAAAVYRGTLLPDDVYEDWAVTRREQARRDFLSVLDIVRDDALAAGRPDEAIHTLERALEVDPDAEDRAALLAETYVAVGRVDEAVRVLDRAAATLAELGLVTPSRHQQLRARLGR